MNNFNSNTNGANGNIIHYVDSTPGGLANFNYCVSSGKGGISIFSINTIYLAMEIVIDGNCDKLGYYNDIDEYTKQEYRFLSHVLGHEIGHMIDAMICGLNSDPNHREKFAEDYLGYLIGRQSHGKKTYKGKIHDR